MNTCSICYQPLTPVVDRLLYEGIPVAQIARQTGLSQQAIGRHKRGDHPVRRGQLAPAGKRPAPETVDLSEGVSDDEYDAIYEAVVDLAYALRGVDPATGKAHKAGHSALDDDGCPAALVDDDPRLDWLMDRALEYRRAAVGGA